MKESTNFFDKNNLFLKNINDLIIQHKNDIYIKTISLLLADNYDEAEAFLVNEFPEKSFNDDPLVQYLMGHIKLKLDEYESSLNYFCHALKNEDNQIPLVYDSRGLTYLFQRDYNGAIRNFKEACSYSQNNFHYHNHLALCYKIILNIQENKEEIIHLSKSKISESEISKKESNLSKSGSLNSSNLDSSDLEKENEKKSKKKGKY